MDSNDTTTKHTTTFIHSRYAWHNDQTCFRMPAGHHGEDYVDPRTLPPEIFYNRDRAGMMQCEASPAVMTRQYHQPLETSHEQTWAQHKDPSTSASDACLQSQNDSGGYSHNQPLYHPSDLEYSARPPQADFPRLEPIYGAEGLPIFDIQTYGGHQPLANYAQMTVPAHLPTPPDTDSHHLFNALQIEGPAGYNLPVSQHITNVPADCPSHIRHYLLGYNPNIEASVLGEEENNVEGIDTSLTSQSEAGNCNIGYNETDSVLVSDSASNMWLKPPRHVKRQYSAELRANGISPVIVANNISNKDLCYDRE